MKLYSCFEGCLLYNLQEIESDMLELIEETCSLNFDNLFKICINNFYQFDSESKEETPLLKDIIKVESHYISSFYPDEKKLESFAIDNLIAKQIGNQIKEGFETLSLRVFRNSEDIKEIKRTFDCEKDVLSSGVFDKKVDFLSKLELLAKK